jgi:murein DD-endopeptidase MepM/ murein hydrolase activator NlpD/lysophospholipase L1-like esterase
VLSKRILNSAVSIFLAFIFLLSSVAHTVAATKNSNNPYTNNPALRYTNRIIFVGENNLCGVGTTTATPAPASGGAQDLARQMLANSNITYWSTPPSGAAADWKDRVPSGGNTTNIDTKDVVTAISEGKKAYTTAGNAANKEADINSDILNFILDAAKEGKVMVNALTDKTHSNGSNHYKGEAIDLDSGSGNTTVPVAKLIEIAGKYGGKKNTESDHHHFDFINTGGAAPESDPSADETGAVYMVGDSITFGAKDGLNRAFQAKNTPAYINASESRSIVRAGTTEGYKTSGLKVLEDDKDRIKNAGSVIVALGTNKDNDFKSNATDLIKKIKEHNSAAKIYWVNVFSDVGHKNSVNSDLKDLETNEGINIIDTTDKNIGLSDDGIHPNSEGVKTFVSTVSEYIQGNSNVAPVTADCACDARGGGGITAAGSNHQEQAFNFFVTTMGYNKQQAAGAVGSLMFESGENLDPKAENPTSHAYGIAQWLNYPPGGPTGRLTDLKKLANYDTFEVQLQNIKRELESDYKTSVDAKMKTAADHEAAQVIWTNYYEGLSGSPEQQHTTQRNANALSVLQKYGSTTGSAAVSSGNIACSTTADGSGEVTGEYSLPLAKKWYTQNKIWFTKDHHLARDGSSNPASDIPVPLGTPVYSMTAGKIISAPNEGGYGEGVTIDAGNGILFFYGHGSDGGSVPRAKQGDTVKAGQLIMHSASTGNSTGPHLHLGITVGGEAVCPQSLFVGIAEGSPPSIASLPKTGCSSGNL